MVWVFRQAWYAAIKQMEKKLFEFDCLTIPVKSTQIG
jgi:hypothetical protein